MSPRLRSGVSHLSDSGRRRAAVRKLTVYTGPGHTSAGPCHEYGSPHTCGYTRLWAHRTLQCQEAVAEAASLFTHCQFPAPGRWSDQYICRGSENVCSRVNVKVVCFSLNSMLSEISQEGNTGRRLLAPPRAHFPFLFI